MTVSRVTATTPILANFQRSNQAISLRALEDSCRSRSSAIVRRAGNRPDAVGLRRQLFAHHGDWQNRTVPITDEVREVLSSTSLGSYFPLSEVPSASSGPLSDLKRTSHEGALHTLNTRLTSLTTGA